MFCFIREENQIVVRQIVDFSTKMLAILFVSRIFSFVWFFMDFGIIYEDKHLLALNKSAGLMVEEDRYGNPNLVSEVKKYLTDKERSKNLIVANVHRLDRPVSGLILFAKRKSLLVKLNEQFAKREVEKIYLAVTDQKPDQQEGRLVHWLVKDTLQKKAIIYTEQVENADKVELEYKILSEQQGKFLWEIKLITGKYHQIRAQLSFIGCPIMGDEKYGSVISYRLNEITLHSRKLSLNYPEGERKMFQAEPPDFFPWTLF